MADEVWTVALDTKGVDAAAVASAQKVEALERELDQLNGAQERNVITAGEFASAHARITTQLSAERATLQGYNSALAGQYGAAQQAGRATQDFARGLQGVGQAAGRGGASNGILLLSQVVDDAQYGFRAIVNQIPSIGIAAGTAFGASYEASAKFGGALGLLGVAINLNLQKLDQWKLLIDDFAGKDFSKGVIDQWNAITFATGRAAEATDKAAEAKRHAGAVKAGEAVDAISSPEARGRGDAFKAALAGESGGGADVRRRLIDAQIKAGGLSQKDLDKEVTLPGGTQTTNSKKIQDGVALMLEAALKGSAQEIAEVSRRLGPAFAQRFDANSPQGKAAVKAEEEQDKRDQAEAAAANEAYEKTVAERAQALAKGDLGTRALGGQFVEVGEVQKALAEVGVEVDKVVADDIRGKFKKAREEEVGKKALDDSVSPAAAAGELLTDRILARAQRQAAAGERARQFGLPGADGPGTKAAQVFGSGQELSKATQAAILNDDKQAELVRLFRENLAAVNKVAENTSPDKAKPAAGGLVLRGTGGAD